MVARVVGIDRELRYRIPVAGHLRETQILGRDFVVLLRPHVVLG